MNKQTLTAIMIFSAMIIAAIILLAVATSNDGVVDENVPPSFPESNGGGLGSWGWFFLVTSIILVVAVIYFWKRTTGFGGVTKSISVGLAKALIVPQLCKDYRIPCLYDHKGVVKLKNKEDLTFNTQHLFKTHVGTKHVALEVEMLNCREPGIHTIIVGLSDGEEAVSEGDYTIHEHLDYKTWEESRYKPKTFPLATFEDQRSQQLQMLANMDPDQRGFAQSSLGVNPFVDVRQQGMVGSYDEGDDGGVLPVKKNIRRGRKT